MGIAGVVVLLVKLDGQASHGFFILPDFKKSWSHSNSAGRPLIPTPENIQLPHHQVESSSVLYTEHQQ